MFVPLHIFITCNIFQAEHFSAVKFVMGYKKNVSFLVIPKSPKVWKIKVKLEWAPLTYFDMLKEPSPFFTF